MAEETILEMSEALDKIVSYALDEAQQKLEQGGNLVPFTVLTDDENLFIETHPGDTVEECFASAQNIIAHAQATVTAYVFCYDGYIDADDGQHDAIIIECADKDMNKGYALCKVYFIDDDEEYLFDEQPVYLDETESFFFPEDENPAEEAPVSNEEAPVPNEEA